MSILVVFWRTVSHGMCQQAFAIIIFIINESVKWNQGWLSVAPVRMSLCSGSGFSDREIPPAQSLNWELAAQGKHELSFNLFQDKNVPISAIRFHTKHVWNQRVNRCTFPQWWHSLGAFSVHSGYAWNTTSYHPWAPSQGHCSEARIAAPAPRRLGAPHN